MSEYGSIQKAQAKRPIGRMIIGVIILVIAVIFMLQNFDDVEVRFFGWSLNMPMWLLMVIMFVLGMLLGGVVRGGVRKLRGKEQPAPAKK